MRAARKWCQGDKFLLAVGGPETPFIILPVKHLVLVLPVRRFQVLFFGSNLKNGEKGFQSCVIRHSTRDEIERIFLSTVFRVPMLPQVCKVEGRYVYRVGHVAHL